MAKMTLGEVGLKPQMPRRNADFVSAYVKYTENQESTQKIHKWVAMSVVAGALERKVWLHRGHYTLYPNLYIFIVGPSGIVKKSTSTAIGVNLLRDLDTMRIMSDRLTAAALINQMSKAQTCFDWGGAKIKQSSLYCYASELIVMLDEIYGSIAELLTTFYDCVPHDSSKPWVYEKAQETARIYGPCLNVLGATTPTWLERAIPVSEMEGGFASRVIFVVETQAPPHFIAWPTLNSETEALRPALLHDLEQIHNLRGPMQVTDGAYKWFTDFYAAHQMSLIRNKDPRFSGYMGRKPDTVLKVGMVLSCSESSALVLEQRHLEKALVWLDELELTMFGSFQHTGKNDYSRELQQILQTIEMHGVIDHVELLRIYGRDLRHEQLIQLVTHLKEAQYVIPFMDSATKRVKYRLHPEFAKKLAEKAKEMEQTEQKTTPEVATASEGQLAGGGQPAGPEKSAGTVENRQTEAGGQSEQDAEFAEFVEAEQSEALQLAISRLDVAIQQPPPPASLKAPGASSSPKPPRGSHKPAEKAP